MSYTGTFDINKFIVVIGGYSIKGYGKDELITLAFDEDNITYTNGAGGTITRVINSKRLATLTITLEQSSLDNDFLSGLFMASITGAIPEPVLIKDLKGNSIYASYDASIIKMTEATYSGTEGKERKWTIKGSFNAFVGGNKL